MASTWGNNKWGANSWASDIVAADTTGIAITSSVGTVEAGIALSSTKLLIKG